MVIYFIGDWMSQVGWGRNGGNLLDFDLGRTLRNGLIGAMFGPLVHYYYDFSDWVLPQEVPVNRVFKIIMDQVRPSVRPSVWPFVRLSFCPLARSVCLSVCLSVCPPSALPCPAL